MLNKYYQNVYISRHYLSLCKYVSKINVNLSSLTLQNICNIIGNLFKSLHNSVPNVGLNIVITIFCFHYTNFVIVKVSLACSVAYWHLKRDFPSSLVIKLFSFFLNRWSLVIFCVCVFFFRFSLFIFIFIVFRFIFRLMLTINMILEWVMNKGNSSMSDIRGENVNF